MSDHATVSSRNSLSTLIDRLSTYLHGILPNPNSRPVLLRLFTYGVFLFAGFVTIVAGGIFAANLAWQAELSFPDAIKAAVGTVTSALGGQLHIGTGSSQSAESADFLVSFALRPTMLTLIFIWVAIRLSKRWTEKFAASDLHAAWIASAIGLGVSTASYVCLYFSQGPLLTFDDELLGSVFGGTWQDFAVIALLIALPVGWTLRSQNSLLAEAVENPTGWMWARQTLSIFAKVFVSLATIAVLTYAVIEVIRPDFQLSTPEATPLLDFSWSSVAAPLISIFMILPTLVLFALMYFSGITIGFDSRSTLGGFDLADNIWSFLTQQADILADRSLFVDDHGTLGVALIIISAITAITAGAWASLKMGYKPTWGQDSRRFLIAASTIGLTLLWITEARISWTNGGTPANIATAGQLKLSAGSLRYGLGAGSVIGLAIVLSVVSIFSGSYLSRFLGLALPRTGRFITGGAKIETGRTGRTARTRIGGGIITLGAILWVAMPVGGAVGERIWAQVDGPRVITQQATAALESGNPAAIAKVSDLPANKNLWLPEPILKRALRNWEQGAPDAKAAIAESSYKLENSNERNWSLGELDVVAQPEWSVNNLTVPKALPINGTVENRFRVLRHATYTWDAKPQYVTLETGPYFPKKLIGQIRVNGEKLKLGSYLAVPGVYRVTAPGVGIIAKTEDNLIAGKSNLIITVGVKAVLPKKVEAKISALAQRIMTSCSKIKYEASVYNITTPCLPDNQIGIKATPDKTYNENYDRYTISKMKNVSLTCSDASATATSSTSMVNSRSCKQKVTFNVRFVTDAVTQPIYETRTRSVSVLEGYEAGACIDYEYGYCWDYEEVPIYRSEQQEYEAVVGRKLISPRKVALIPFTSDVNFTIDISAKKTRSGFTVKKK